MTKEQIITIVTTNGLSVVSNTRMSNNYGDSLRLSNKCVINIYDSGTIQYQGKNWEQVKALIESTTPVESIQNRKIFVVYGHDLVARTELEAMLRRWNLDPLILDQLGSSGMTIIEKLEEYISQANFGIVLATPDDIGYAKNDESLKKFRVRQNVVLEMGMLLAKLGRSKVAILLKNTEEMERPSDIQGLIYIPFTDKVDETALSLAKELGSNGYTIDITKL